MPAALPYSWVQTDATLDVSVQLRHADRRRPEVQVSRVHLQVNSPPQLLVLDLYGSIEHNAASVRVDSDGVTFALRKVSLTPTQTKIEGGCYRVLLGPVTYNPAASSSGKGRSLARSAVHGLQAGAACTPSDSYRRRLCST